MNMPRRLYAAFTIVELMVVIVVIGILAGLVVVGYSGATKKAQETAVKSDLQQATIKLGSYLLRFDAYPISYEGDVAVVADNTNFTYTRFDPGSFCLTGVSSQFETIVFHVDQDKVVRTGYCEAHTPIALSCFASHVTNGVVKITDYYDKENNIGSNPACPRSVRIPSSIGGVDVKLIGSSAFYNNQLTSVSIPTTITTIEMDAFSFNQLKTLDIPDSVTTIDGSAFIYNQISSLKISNSLEILSGNVFGGNQLTSVVIPNSVKSIQGGAFWNNKLTSLTIPDTVTYIGEYAFESNNISVVSLPVTLTSVGDSAFAGNAGIQCNIPYRTYATITAVDIGCSTINAVPPY